MSRLVLSADESAETTADNAAWDLLTAVRELFPEEFARLEDLRVLPEADRDRHVREWTRHHGISCRSVDRMADWFVHGENAPPETVTGFILADNGELVDAPSMPAASPFDETLKEFLARARKHYQEVRDWYQERGYKGQPVKRELDHFRYLAAYLVGGHAWAEMARGGIDRLKDVQIRSANTIAGEARKAAGLIGLSLSGKPGPRVGTKRPRSRLRPRRP
jgi:hypothetical protein